MELEVPSFYKYQNLEKDLWAEFVKAKDIILKRNGEEEARLALEKGDFILVNGIEVPCITVVVDGSWSKRSYGHGYNASGGMAVIIGERTGKVLYIGTRIKSCQTCKRAENKGKDPPTHDCQRNWDKSSTSMETDIVVEGFQRSMDMHGLIYRWVIIYG